MENEKLGELFLKITLYRMTDMYLPKFREALSAADPGVLWAEPYHAGNSVGGISLHVAEHIARSRLRLQQRSDQLKPNFERYFPSGDQTAKQLIELIEQELLAWRNLLLERLNHGPGIDTEQMHQLYDVVEHTGYHLGQIIDRIQAATGRKFSFVQNGLNEAYLRRKIEEGELDETNA